MIVREDNETKWKRKRTNALQRDLILCPVTEKNALWRRYNTGRFCVDCNYCTFSEWRWLRLQTVTFANMRVMTPSLRHCISKRRECAVIINEQEDMHGTSCTFFFVTPWTLFDLYWWAVLIIALFQPMPNNPHGFNSFVARERENKEIYPNWAVRKIYICSQEK